MQLTRMLARWFPTPTLLSPRAAGVDITDGSIKWVTLAKSRGNVRVASWGYEILQPGVVVNGAVRDVKALASALMGLKKKFGATHAHASLPEEGAYVFSMHIPEGSSRRDVRSMIEFELEGRVPIPISEAVYDYDIIEKHRGGGSEIAVAVFPRELAGGYIAAFLGAGIYLSSLEIEARSIGRAIASRGERITMLVDAGKARTGIAILKNNVPIFTSTVEVGGGSMTETLMQTLSLTETEAEQFKNEEGLIVSDKNNTKGAEALEKIVSGLAAEVVRHFHFWDTRRNEHGERVTPIEEVLLVGGCANLKGITDYIAGKVRAETDRPSVWGNVCSFDDYIPPIDRRTSLQYATAVGLALRGI